ncbi:unnamed protein product [marine sediment metagenome]|uniref:Uncharacterized protein n=1 Tax=marine sediment metagenome TaxID=412755 RepID=X1MP62_9ZZZZ
MTKDTIDLENLSLKDQKKFCLNIGKLQNADLDYGIDVLGIAFLINGDWVVTWAIPVKIYNRIMRDTDKILRETRVKKRRKTKIKRSNL